MTLPDALKETHAFLACLSERPERRTCLLQERSTHKKQIMKYSALADELQTEYNWCCRLAGRGVPECLCVWKEADGWYMLREYIPGQTLAEIVAAQGMLPMEKAATLCIELCAILERLHCQQPPVIHRDIKAENLLLTPDGQLYLIDMGIARAYDQTAARDTLALGTPAVAPPEQFGYQQTDPRSDIYACGMLLRYLLTGESQPGKTVPDRRMERIIRRCTAFSPEKRYRDAHALKGALWHWRQSAKLKPARFFLVAALCLSLVFGATAVFSTHKKVYRFQSPEIAQAVSQRIGKPIDSIRAEDLLQIDTLLLAGDHIPDQWEDLTFYASDLQSSGETINGYGTLHCLNDLAQMPNLQTLALCNQQITDLSPLAGLPLQRLDLHGNQIVDLSPLASCTELREVRVSENPLTDLSPLENCPQLYMLNASRTLLTSAGSLQTLHELQTLYLMDCQRLNDISALGNCENLRGLSLWPCNAQQLADIAQLADLRWLSLWWPEGLTSLQPLASLTSLEGLFLDSEYLENLTGVEAFASLKRLTLFNAPVQDLSPLTKLNGLTELNLHNITPVSWEPLKQMRNLHTLVCDAEALPEVRQFFHSAMANTDD